MPLYGLIYGWNAYPLLYWSSGVHEILPHTTLRSMKNCPTTFRPGVWSRVGGVACFKVESDALFKIGGYSTNQHMNVTKVIYWILRSGMHTYTITLR